MNRAVAALADKWKILLILTLQDRTMRFRELLAALDGIAPKVMSRQLRSLEADGLVTRTAYAEVPPRVEYSLTRAGRTLLPILNDLQQWAIENNDELSPAITGAERGVVSVTAPVSLAGGVTARASAG
ncbi:MAG: helix-turn-helix transcriptional regulator [Candidatus Eremiobacteraeota bacterium]|nr:helix-turn-helix transcriptional regulator [Candidatus Eremiobacteraeota bacterium]